MSAVSRLKLRYMRLADIEQVVAIDARSFDPPWSPRSYAFEIEQSTCSHMVVLEEEISPPARSWRSLLAFRRPGGEERRRIVAYGGLWKIQDEAHISTIASHPDLRGHSYGEIALASMVLHALHLNAGYVVLEVRVSNGIAQNLYRKYGFEVTGVKENYYQSNHEDAYDMRLLLDQQGIAERIESLYYDLKARVTFEDEFSATPHPRGLS